MSDDTYTHRPGAVEGGDADAEVSDPAAPVERGTEEWDWRGWVLVGVIVVCFLVVPATILLIPPGGPFKAAYLVLPLLPAFLLGATAVWSAQRSS
ncbi:hypothetical protein [Halorussus marinus]|uniref:hypothetical protein n=1 Tax=Halorussus marinus TaxID=2505976 RepID=UPI00106EA8D4|nr:hypothetical protein [Halorussus marinus]